MPGSKSLVGVFNNPTDSTFCELRKASRHRDVRWMAWQVEKGASGTTHIQLSVVFTRRKTSKQASAFLQGIASGCTCIKHMESVVIDLTGDSGDETEELPVTPPTTPTTGGGHYQSQLRVVIPGSTEALE